MDKKFTQVFTVWLLPLIIIGGLFFPVLGYLALLMMIVLLSLSFFKARFWCGHLCPRGAFLDLVLSRFSLKKKIPRFITTSIFRWAVFVLFISFFILQLITVKKDFFSVGFIFVRMCLVTTMIAVIFGIPLHQRVWCMVCPMGLLQEKLHSLNRKSK